MLSIDVRKLELKRLYITVIQCLGSGAGAHWKLYYIIQDETGVCEWLWVGVKSKTQDTLTSLNLFHTLLSAPKLAVEFIEYLWVKGSAKPYACNYCKWHNGTAVNVVNDLNVKVMLRWGRHCTQVTLGVNLDAVDVRWSIWICGFERDWISLVILLSCKRWGPLGY